MIPIPAKWLVYDWYATLIIRVILNYFLPGVRRVHLLCAGWCAPGMAQMAICVSARCLKTTIDFLLSYAISLSRCYGLSCLIKSTSVIPSAVIAPLCVTVRTSVHLVHMVQKITSTKQHNRKHNCVPCLCLTASSVAMTRSMGGLGP